MLLLIGSCTSEVEIKTLRAEQFNFDQSAIGDGDLLKLVVPALDVDNSMDLKVYYHHLVYSIEHGDTFNLISPIAFKDTTKTYQFLIESSYAYLLTTNRLMTEHGVPERSLPAVDLILYNPALKSLDFISQKAIIGALSADKGTEHF